MINSKLFKFFGWFSLNLILILTGVDRFKYGSLVHEPKFKISVKMAAELIWQNSKNVLRITFFFTFFMINILGLFIIHMIVSLSLRCVHRKTFRKVQKFFETLFVRLLLSLVQVIAGNEFVLSLPETEKYSNVKITQEKFQKIFESSNFKSDNGCTIVSRDLIISNHQIYSDWIYLWSLMDRIDRAGEVKIIMKRSLRQVPIFGWSMRFFDFVFLNRKWEQDQAHFTKKLKGFVDSESPFCLLIFPEGTTLNHKALAKSESFATKLGVKPTSRVLLPRVLGLWEAVKGLDPSLNGIFDITVGYSDLCETDEPEKIYTLGKLFFNGFSPKQVHYHLSYISLKEIPRESADEFGEWLRERYYEKDRLLDEFYKTGQFPNSRSVTKKLCPRYYLWLTLLQTVFCLASFYGWYLLSVRLVFPSITNFLSWLFNE
jgi:1-acyl-sn-glycerol-3-phosphate acyltransferase